MTERRSRRVLQITALPFPPEIRVVKEGLTLAEAGYLSAVLCPPIKGRPERELWRGIDVFRPAMLSASASAADKLIYQSMFFSPAWFKAIRHVLAEYPADVIHVHDIWLGRTAFAARGRQKMVMDLHENMPAAVVQYLKGYRGGMKLFNAVFRNPLRVLRYERALLTKSDRVFVVVEEAAQRVLETHPALPAEKVINVENLESKEFIAEIGTAEKVLARDHFSVLYIGGFGPHRGIDTLIRAMTHIKAWGVNARVHLVGARPRSAYLQMLEQLIAELDVASHVTVTGWVPPEKVLAYVRQASVGAVPHHSNPHTNTTIPHKLFQYMIASTPVLVSTSPPLARTARASGAGVVFQAGNDRDCAEKIRDMAAEPGRLADYGVRGYKYVMQDGHNWEDESAPRLIAAYDRLLEA